MRMPAPKIGRGFGRAALSLALLALVHGAALAQLDPQIGKVGEPPAPPAGQVDQPPVVPTEPPVEPQQQAVYYRVNEQKQPVGPLTLAQMEQLIRQGQINARSNVWVKGSPAWVSADKVPELKRLIDVPAVPVVADGPPPPPANDIPKVPEIPQVPEVQAIYFRLNEQRQPLGPLTVEQIAQLVKEGLIKPDTLMTTKGGAAWQAANQFPEFAKLFPPVDKWKTFILGTWEVRINYSNYGMTVTSRATYHPDGTFIGYTSTQSAPLQGYQAPPSVNRNEGRWSTKGMEADKFLLTLNSDMNGTQTVVLQRIDEDTLQSDQGFTARRISR